jgi:hypothetical protein
MRFSVVGVIVGLPFRTLLAAFRAAMKVRIGKRERERERIIWEMVNIRPFITVPIRSRAVLFNERRKHLGKDRNTKLAQELAFYLVRATITEEIAW